MLLPLPLAAADQTPERIEFAAIANAVEVTFASLADYRPGDLISRSHVALALAAVDKAGWQVPAEKIMPLALPDNSFLVSRLRTPSGHRFMRKISTQPGAYARLDRLSTIPRGETLVNDLIRTKGGYELVIYMAAEPGGRNMGRQLAVVPHGVDINKPTGRIYTAEDLIAALKRLWDAAP